jgi:hypothetical protein
MPIRNLRKRVAARKNKKKTTSAKTHVGDVLGLGTARPPRKPVKSAGKTKRRKGIEITRKRSRTHLRPARVRG